jgi:hypothetical protein
MAGDDLPDDSDPKPGEIIGGATGTIAQLTDTDGGATQTKARRTRRKRKRPIGFQLGELGHLDDPVKED